ncbi:GlcG/HbpS family heme-binding protein [Inquilinus limosus]|uniref:GlcG protein n=1 Tax=Inquilinus limosus TaxID=171674 RepID=A0A211ZVC8_9PROT|nr:heme-binding protein [Inquilinus limosus]OWJ69252.1 glcG protein [Inquilinus limosus]
MRHILGLVLAVALGGLVLSQRDAHAQVTEKKVLTLAAARKMVAAAEGEAQRNGWPGVIAIVDDGGWPIVIERMDNAALVAGVVLAPGKARTAALFKRPSQALEDAINNGRTAAVTASDFIEMKGALPIVLDGRVIGAIGVSADTPDHDVQIAQAGLAAFTP